MPCFDLAGHHARSVYSVAWSHQTGLIATGCGDNHVRVFKVASAQNSASAHAEQKQQQADALKSAACVLDVVDHTQDVNCVVWCHDGQLASAGDDELVAIRTVQCHDD